MEIAKSIVNIKENGDGKIYQQHSLEISSSQIFSLHPFLSSLAMCIIMFLISSI